MTHEYIAAVCLGYLTKEESLVDFLVTVSDIAENAIPEPDTPYYEREMWGADNPWYELYQTRDDLFQIANEGILFTESDLASAGISSPDDLLGMLMDYVKENNYYGF